mmetsp:Transcript_111638/g.315274  ORF Transcript_111638/g.315274 Transcript_111638/m.315274 type:complete len:204 (+) Transcript_111638:196-807(+)
MNGFRTTSPRFQPSAGSSTTWKVGCHVWRSLCTGVGKPRPPRAYPCVTQRGNAHWMRPRAEDWTLRPWTMRARRRPCWAMQTSRMKLSRASIISSTAWMPLSVLRPLAHFARCSCSFLRCTASWTRITPVRLPRALLCSSFSPLTRTSAAPSSSRGRVYSARSPLGSSTTCSTSPCQTGLVDMSTCPRSHTSQTWPSFAGRSG